MLIQTSSQASIPKRLASEILSAPASTDGCPGLVVSTKHLLQQSNSISATVSSLVPNGFVGQYPALFVKPDDTSEIFLNSDELSFLKSVSKEIASLVHPHLKMGVDAIWLVYGATDLHKEWSQSDSDKVACAFKLAGLVASAASLVGAVSPDLKLPDSWSNGINYVVKSGDAIYQGKTQPITDSILAIDKRMDVPLKLLKLAGVSLDPEPEPNPYAINPLARVTLLSP